MAQRSDLSRLADLLGDDDQTRFLVGFYRTTTDGAPADEIDTVEFEDESEALIAASKATLDRKLAVAYKEVVNEDGVKRTSILKTYGIG